MIAYKSSGYLAVKINGKNKYIHKLVAEYFLTNNYKNEKTQIHHKDKNRKNNRVDNLIILSESLHRDIHRKKESLDNENILSQI